MATAPQLSARQMTEYLKQLVDVETRLQLLRKELDAFQSECRARNERPLPSTSSDSFITFAEYERNFRADEEKTLAEIRKKNNAVRATSVASEGGGQVSILVGAASIVAGLLFLVYSFNMVNDDDNWYLYYGDPSFGSKTIALAAFICLICCAMGIFGILAGLRKTKESRSELERIGNRLIEEPAPTPSENVRLMWEDKHRLFEAERQKERAEAERYNREVQAYNGRRAEMIHEFYDAISETDDVRVDLYNLYRVIHPKYRNLAAICTIYDYFSTGRVSALQGPDGAYNLYEAELRQNAIIDRLDSIEGKLDDLRRGQYQLYLAVNEANRQLSEFRGEVRRIGDDVRSIKASSAVTAACSRATAANTEALKYIALATA